MHAHWYRREAQEASPPHGDYRPAACHLGEALQGHRRSTDPESRVRALGARHPFVPNQNNMTMTKSTKQIVAPTQILSQRELADYLGLCERSVRKLENKGVLPFIKLGKRTVYRMDSVLEALKKLEEQSTPKPTASVPNP